MLHCIGRVGFRAFEMCIDVCDSVCYETSFQVFRTHG